MLSSSFHRDNIQLRTILGKQVHFGKWPGGEVNQAVMQAMTRILFSLLVQALPFSLKIGNWVI